MVSLLQPSQRSQFLKALIVVFILATVAVGAIPNYFTGRWSWNRPPEVPHLSQLQRLKQEGLTLPEWRTLKQEVKDIGGHHWSIQAIEPKNKAGQTSQAPVLLMLRPQTWHRDQPQVDWMDINGVQRWTADSKRALRFTVTTPASKPGSSPKQQTSTKVTARFFRGWNQQQTYAVLQWYAWSNGGHSAPNQWFWADQIAQWRDRHRMPWVAVSILLPIQPLGDIETVQNQAESLGQSVQSALMVSTFNSNS